MAFNFLKQNVLMKAISGMWAMLYIKREIKLKGYRKYLVRAPISNLRNKLAQLGNKFNDLVIGDPSSRP